MISNLKIIDELGEVQAQMADLKKQADALKAQLVEAGPGAYEGNLFRATVSTYERTSFDIKAARAKLWDEGFYAFVKKHTSSSKCVRVSVVAKTGQKEAA